MKPYPQQSLTRPQRVFNYWISRGRRVVENTFGILAARWRCLLTKLMQSPQVVQVMLRAMLCLHNLMRIRFPTSHVTKVDQEDEHQIVPGAWRNDAVLPDVQLTSSNRFDLEEGKNVCETLLHYFGSEAGHVPWQDRS